MYRLMLILLLGTLACARNQTGGAAAQADRIRALDSAWLEAAAVRDFEAMMAIFASDARALYPELPPIEGRDAIERFFRDMAEANPRFVHQVSPDSITVAASGDLAVVTGRYRFMPDSLVPDAVDAGKFVGIWTRDGGDWRLAVDISNADPPAAGEDSVRAVVLDVVTSYYAAFSDRDWPRFAAHFWPGATLTTAWQPPGEQLQRVVVQSLPEFLSLTEAGPGSREVFEERMRSAEVTVRGPLAIVIARYWARFGDPGDMAEWEGTDVFTLFEHGGSWRITSLAFASDL